MNNVGLWFDAICLIFAIVVFPLYFYAVIKIASIAWFNGQAYVNKKNIREILDGKD